MKPEGGDPGLPHLNAHKRGAGRGKCGLVPIPGVIPGGLEAADIKQWLPTRGGMTAPLNSGTRAGRPGFGGLGPEGGTTKPERRGDPPADRKQSRARATADGSARLQPPALRRQPGTDLHLGSPSPETILSLPGGGRQGKEGEARPGS